MTTSSRRPSRRLVGFCATLAAFAVGAATVPASALGGLAVNAGPDFGIAEGATMSRSIAVTDAVDDGAPGWDATVDYGDGTVTTTRITALSVPLFHAYADGPAQHTMSITVTDEPGESATDTATVTVLNDNPTPLPAGTATTPEGSAYQLTLNGTDPGGAADPLLFSVDWADGFSSAVLIPSGVTTHLYADDTDGPSNATAHNVLVVVYDDDGGSGLVTMPVTVTNVAPTVSLTGAAAARVGATHSVSIGQVVDPGRDTVSAMTLRWGDGTSQSVTPGSTVSHTYTATGTMAIGIDVIDEDGTWIAGSSSVNVSPAAPVVPTAPTSLAAAPVSRSSIRLTWTNTSTTQTEIQVERCQGAGCTRFSRVATLAGSATSFSDSRLSSNKVYTYRIRARSTAGASPWSNVASARTLR